MVSAMQLMHNVVADQAGDNGPVCDSWAAGSSGRDLHREHAVVHADPR